jgi:hypothetical protein
VNCFTLGQKINTEEADYARVAAARAAATPTSEICRSMRQGAANNAGSSCGAAPLARLAFVSSLGEAKLDRGKAVIQILLDAHAGEIL